MAKIDTVFVTKIYRASLRGRNAQRLNTELKSAISTVADEDVAGQRWSENKGFKGYTSYASLADLTWRMPEFAALQQYLDTHVGDFAKELDLDIGNEPLVLDSIWINVLEPGGVHGAHIHPNSVVSGTYYVDVPTGAGAIRFEDPRLQMMMAAPMRKDRARSENKSFISIEPKPGMLLLWESWLRHEVPMNAGEEERISISFNYGTP
ncbi:MAG: TIGR02466 family protein [Hyphomicrobiaceae bacterium]